MQTVLHLVPDRPTAQRLFNDVVKIGFVARQPVDARAIGDIVVDRFGEWVWLLKHHANLGAELHRIDTFVIDVFAVDTDISGHTGSINSVVHSIDTAKKSRLAAA